MEVAGCARGCLTSADLAEPNEGSALSTIYESAPEADPILSGLGV